MTSQVRLRRRDASARLGSDSYPHGTAALPVPDGSGVDPLDDSTLLSFGVGRLVPLTTYLLAPGRGGGGP